LSKSLPASDPQAERISVYRAECQGVSGKLPEAVAQLEGIIAKTSDKDLKALAYNALGDCYRLNNRPREALWPYLWVDVIYHQDRQEHLKAMADLAKLFAEQGDTARAKEYRDKLKREAR
jgi:lipopolysaccharide biosynthesis regulator YciM